MTAEDVVKILAEIGESFLWTILILIVFIVVVSGRADKE